MTRKLLLLVAIFASAIFASAQMANPIRWTTDFKHISSTEGELIMKAEVDKGWHLYGTELPDGGPRPTSIDYTEMKGCRPVGTLTFSTTPEEKVDMVFHLRLSWWEDDVTLTQRFEITDPKSFALAGTISFQGCNDSACMAPSKVEFEYGSTATASEDTASADTIAATTASAHSTAGTSVDLWAPVEMPAGEGDTSSDSSAWYIFIWGFMGGLLALMTPCVWPMIPLTVSFFLKKSGSRSRSIRDAVIYGLSIVVIYLALGLIITFFFGSGKLNELSTNAVFNLIFFALLVVFAISFFGAFDITLPSSWSNAMDGKVERTSGMLSIFFMAFTLALVSFSCTGPIIGTLLVQAASEGEIVGPAIGMGAFALALAIPFTLFAVFPSWLKEMPRSGSWLNSVKVVLGFLELALSLKFLSVADLAYGWRILDREIFIALWVVIFILLGMYLLGKIKFSHDSDLDHVSIPRFFLALASLSLAVYLVPGLWGAPLKGVSAFVPPLYTQDFNLYAGGQFREFHDYDEGMAYAAEANRPVLIDFSGHGCVNCRKMEGAVFDTQEVASLIKENFVLIKLMVDEKADLEHPYTVTENSRKVKITTVGDKWSYLQRSKFGANTQPYYVILDNQGQPLNHAYSYDENVAKFVEWLETGIHNYANH
ncbi:MAG: thioredoxin family protein [Lachnoclostridium sp.]|nr:thioredoxin family protein [Lachnoclostridium sp.]